MGEGGRLGGLLSGVGGLHTEREQREHFERSLNTLGVTTQRFVELAHQIGRESVTTVDKIEPVLSRPIPSPLGRLRRINADTLSRNLRAALDALGVGYCYEIRRRGAVLHVQAAGAAQAGSDGPISWAPHIPMNMASVSKFVTAIALAKLLPATDIPLTSPVAPYLPQFWTQGPDVGSITFHALLRHEAGLGDSITDSGAGNFAEARREIANGPKPSRKGTYLYRNVNFALLRVLFATVTGTLDTAATAPPFLGLSDDAFWDLASALAYAKVVNETVFAPASIAARDYSAEPNAALAYATPPAAPGARIVDGPGGSGQSGWHLSIGELARLLDEFTAGAMMPKPQAHELLSNMYGLDRPLATSAGTVYRKGGRKLSGMQGMDSAIYLMPGDMQLAVHVNSWDGTEPGHLGRIPDLIESSTERTL